ncbi:MAG: CvpA family protein [Planctomycetes bacterium]|nr:CvpA family protein [Planctomycetota bacterium]
MWVSLALFALFAMIAYLHAIQGLFSALIGCVLSILSLCVAFSQFEYVAHNWLASWRPDFAMPIAFIGLFCATLLGTRVLADNLIRRACLLPMIVDRVGGGVFGVLVGMIITGMLAIALQMIPLGGSMLGYSRFKPPPPPRGSGADDVDVAEDDRLPDDEHDIFLNPDRFVVRLASMMGSGVFSGQRDWYDTHPDFIQEIGWSQATIRRIGHLAPPGSVSLVSVGSADILYEKATRTGRRVRVFAPTYEPVSVPAEKKWYTVRVKLGNQATDSDGTHRFMLRQARLLGKDRPDAPALTQYYAMGLADNNEEFPDRLVVGDIDKIYGPDPQKEVTLVYEVPDSFVPYFLDYKSGARVDLTSQPDPDSENADTLASAFDFDPPPSFEPPSTPEPEPEKRQSKARVRGAEARGAGTRWGSALPVSLTDYSIRDPEFDRGRNMIRQGELLADLDKQDGSSSRNTLVERLWVPDDKRLLQFSASNLRGGSALGRAKLFAVKVLENYEIHGANGQTYTMVGKYAIAEVGGQHLFELQYFPVYAAAGARTHRQFQRIRDRHLSGDNYTLVFLYLIDPGVQVVKFSTGGSSSYAQDLTQMNLVAPD